MAYKAGCIAVASITDGQLEVEVLNQSYKGSKQLTIWNSPTTSNSSGGDYAETLFSASGATIGMIAGYYDANGAKHVIELTKSRNYWVLPGAVFANDGTVYLTEYASLDGATQTSNTVTLNVCDGNGVTAENTPEDTKEWRDVIDEMITTKMNSYTPVLKNALSILKGTTTISDRETGAFSSIKIQTNYTGEAAASITVNDRLPCLYPLIIKYTDASTSTNKYFAYYGDEKVSINLDDVIKAMGITASGTGTLQALTVTGNSSTYTYDGSASVRINLKTEVTNIVNSLLDGDSSTY